MPRHRANRSPRRRSSTTIFVDACRNLENKNEARIIQDISRFIVPSAESLALRNKNYKRLVESVTKGGTTRSPSPAPVHGLTTPLGSNEMRSPRISSPSCRRSLGLHRGGPVLLHGHVLHVLPVPDLRGEVRRRCARRRRPAERSGGLGDRIVDSAPDEGIV